MPTRCPHSSVALWNGYPEETNAPYGIAKKAHLIHAQVDAEQYGSKPDGQPRRAVDGSLARELLGWTPAMEFDDGLRATIDWYLANRADAERI